MKLPKEAKKVFEGIIFDVYQWNQEQFDGSYKTFEMVKRPDTVQIIAVQGDNVLLAEEEQPGRPKAISFLGGRVDAGETPLQAAQRELLEETGMQAEAWDLYAAYEPLSKMDWRIHYFIARNCKKVHEPHLEAGERISIHPVSFEEFIALVLNRNMSAHELEVDILRLVQNNKIEELRKKIYSM